MRHVIKHLRFSLLMKFLHLNDSNKYIRKGQPGHDALFKLRPFIEPLISNFQQNYTLHREVFVDETMISFKGHLGFIQYMPKKPTKWGLKAFVLSNWHLYTGKCMYTHVKCMCTHIIMDMYMYV